jgi:NTP pyrophosphatase (non-canonical NTP hydrolase)
MTDLLKPLSDEERDEYLLKLGAHIEWCPESPPPNPRLMFMCLGLAGEAGELANLAKKEWRKNKGDADIYSKMCDELADVFGYALMIASELGIDPCRASYEKIKVVEQRPEWKEFEKRFQNDEG